MTSIYIDTNVFLDFYQSATDRMEIFQDLRERAECLVVPLQTVKEFRRNRAARLMALANQVEKSAQVNIHTTAIVRGLPVFKEWAKARVAIKTHAKTIATQLRTWARDESSDPVCQQFVQLYCEGMTIMTPHDALAKAQARKLLGDPPTSPDKHTVGDEIIWETLLSACDKDLIIVSRDRTFLDNESILRNEFDIAGKRRLVRVTGSLSDALRLIGKPSIPIEAAENAERIREAAEGNAFETGRCPKCDTKMKQTGFEGGDGEEFWWLICPKCSYEAA